MRSGEHRASRRLRGPGRRHRGLRRGRDRHGRGSAHDPGARAPAPRATRCGRVERPDGVLLHEAGRRRRPSPPGHRAPAAGGVAGGRGGTGRVRRCGGAERRGQGPGLAVGHQARVGRGAALGRERHRAARRHPAPRPGGWPRTGLELGLAPGPPRADGPGRHPRGCRGGHDLGRLRVAHDRGAHVPLPDPHRGAAGGDGPRAVRSASRGSGAGPAALRGRPPGRDRVAAARIPARRLSGGTTLVGGAHRVHPTGHRRGPPGHGIEARRRRNGELVVAVLVAAAVPASAAVVGARRSRRAAPAGRAALDGHAPRGTAPISAPTELVGG